MAGRGPSGIRLRPVGQGGAIAIAKARSGARWMRMRVHPAVAQICDFLSAYLGSSVLGGLGTGCRAFMRGPATGIRCIALRAAAWYLQPYMYTTAV